MLLLLFIYSIASLFTKRRLGFAKDVKELVIGKEQEGKRILASLATELENSRINKINYLLKQNIAQFAIVVRDYDEAIEFYTQKLKFDLLEDTALSATKRWVRVAPKGSTASAILLAKASGEEQESRIGNQAGGRVFLFLHTDDFDRDYQNLLAHQITIVREPSVEVYGKVAVFEDLYGNKWDLIQPNN